MHTYKLKRGLAESFKTKNPLLEEGEPGFELDTFKLKIGNGKTKYNDLPYINMSNEPAIVELLQNIHDGTNYGLWQESEKDDTNITLKFTDVPLTPEEREIFVKAYDRTQTGKTAVAFGSSVATGDRSLAAGSSNVAAGGKSIALGCDNYVGSNQAIAIGYANYAGGKQSPVALGHMNRATGAGAFAANTETVAAGDASVAMNTGTQALGRYSAAFGNRTIAEGDNQFVIGKFNEPNTNTYFIIGNGNNDDERRNAMEVYHNGIVRLPQNTYDNFIAEGNKITGGEIVTADILSRILEDIDIKGAVEQKTRAEATNPYAYDHEQNSVPYLYGRYGDKETGEEKEGLIKTSIGGIKKEIDKQIDIDFANGIITEKEKEQYHSKVLSGEIPVQYRNMLDVHTLPIRDGNCAIPVGIHIYDEDENGNMINSKLWYGAAAPAAWVQNSLQYGKLLPIRRGTSNPNHNGVTGWDTGVWQIPEEKYMTSGINIRSKNAAAADYIDRYNSQILKSSGLTKLNADENQLIGALGQYSASFGGCSSAQGKRAFAEGTNTVAIGKYSHAEGDNSVTLGNDSHAEGYGTVTYGNASHAEGSGSIAEGMASHAGGSVTLAKGDASFAHGTGTQAIGTHSAAFGNNTKTSRDNSFVIGTYNKDSNAVFAIGNGSADTFRQNIFEVYDGYDNDYEEPGVYFYSSRLASEYYTDMLNNNLRKEIKNKYGRKSVSGEILEIKDLDNPFNAVITSTVTDNYFYKKNFIVEKAQFDEIEELVKSTPARIAVYQSGNYEQAQFVTILRDKYSDGMVQGKTGYVVFKTPADLNKCNRLQIDNWSTDIGIKCLKPNHQYLLIVSYGTSYDDGTRIRVNYTLPYLVDYEDSYHWVAGQSADEIPCPYTIMIPHVGRIDKGDTLTIEYQCSEAAGAIYKKLEQITELLETASEGTLNFDDII